jgi:hypothetical protein
MVAIKDHAGRAKQAIAYGRRGKGDIFGAFWPATGDAFTKPYPGRGTACWVAFPEELERAPASSCSGSAAPAPAASTARYRSAADNCLICRMNH